ncbi:MAG: deazaflavin-dependent nitroreductase family protein [Mycobacterium sp.]|nr:deazaflavin-dependent nitroreductase family protein [Mycobacterium sp.]
MTLNTNCDHEIGLDGPYVPSPSERVRTQVADYEASGGVEGATLEGRPVVILTSVGAKSGKVRKNPVMRIVDGDRYVAVASAGGSLTNPSWYANLVAHPKVRLQDGASVKRIPSPRNHRRREAALLGDRRAVLAALSRIPPACRQSRHPDHGVGAHRGPRNKHRRSHRRVQGRAPAFGGTIPDTGLTR